MIVKFLVLIIIICCQMRPAFMCSWGVFEVAPSVGGMFSLKVKSAIVFVSVSVHPAIINDL